MRILIANRGEIAIRVARAVRELGYEPVMVAPLDDQSSRHVSYGDTAVRLPGAGPASYLDIAALINAAREARASAIHPGYGFLSESTAFAQACEEEGLTFIGPSSGALSLLGDKSRCRVLAQDHDIPVAHGLEGPVTLDQAKAFIAQISPGSAVMVKALAGGGGRGTAPVRSPEDIEAVFAQCSAEAAAAVGNDALYLEELIDDARHIEVQVLRDHDGAAIHLFERECSLQRRRQKLIEIAPSPWINDETRAQLFDAAIAMADASALTGLATFEFLVRNQPVSETASPFVFMEANPRLQVEHTVTEEISGVDLVQAQVEIALGKSLKTLGIDKKTNAQPRGYAMQLRINAEEINAQGLLRPASGTLSVFEAPVGPGMRIDSAAHVGYSPNPSYDSLLAKLIVHSEQGGFTALLNRTRCALAEFGLSGCETNQAFLAALLQNPDVQEGRWDTELVDREMVELCAEALQLTKRLSHHRYAVAEPASNAANKPVEIPDGCVAIRSEILGVVIAAPLDEGSHIASGQEITVLEAMKMQHPVVSPVAGTLVEVCVKIGDMVSAGAILAVVLTSDDQKAGQEHRAPQDLDYVRPELEQLQARKKLLADAARPEAIAKLADRKRRSARQNVCDLCDEGTFVEMGGLSLAAQRMRRDVDDLRRYSPADGMIAGVGTINGEVFGQSHTRCAVFAYDYSVFAGTQGVFNHKKKDRLFDLAHRQKLPVVFFAGGGGGRPGETDVRLGLDVSTFARFAKLKRRVPIIAIVSGPCFAGNAALAGCADVVIAVKGSNLGMGGPAMIEGGGLGKVTASEIGPVAMQAENGVIDMVVADEAEAVRVAKRCLAVFQGSTPDFEAVDQRLMRHAVPEDRVRVYDVRRVIEILADADSFVELKNGFGRGMVTGFVRLGGAPCGVVANNPICGSGAIDADGAQKAADFLKLCDVWRLPVITLCDTPGFMVGIEAEKRKQVQQSCRLFETGANLRVPLFSVVLRKAYGLGAQAMAGGGFHMPFYAASWPTGEFGAMGFEGAVRLGYRKELEALKCEAEKEAFFQQKLEEMYEENSAISAAEFFEIDDVIDPAQTREHILLALATAGAH